MIESLGAAFQGVNYTAVDVSKVIDGVAVELPMISDYLVELRDWIITQIS